MGTVRPARFTFIATVSAAPNAGYLEPVETLSLT